MGVQMHGDIKDHFGGNIVNPFKTKLASNVCIQISSYLTELYFNRTQIRVVVGLLTGHNNLRRHLHVMGLSNDPACRKCGTEEETSVHILCECEALASLRHQYLGSIFLGPRGY